MCHLNTEVRQQIAHQHKALSCKAGGEALAPLTQHRVACAPERNKLAALIWRVLWFARRAGLRQSGIAETASKAGRSRASSVMRGVGKRPQVSTASLKSGGRFCAKVRSEEALHNTCSPHLCSAGSQPLKSRCQNRFFQGCSHGSSRRRIHVTRRASVKRVTCSARQPPSLWSWAAVERRTRAGGRPRCSPAAALWSPDVVDHKRSLNCDCQLASTPLKFGGSWFITKKTALPKSRFFWQRIRP